MGAAWELLGASCGPLGSLLGGPWELLGASWGPLGAPQGGSQSGLGRMLERLEVKVPFECDLEATWSRLGAVLGPSWATWSRLGSILGPSWGQLGAILAPPAAVLGPPWALLGPSWGLFWRLKTPVQEC